MSRRATLVVPLVALAALIGSAPASSATATIVTTPPPVSSSSSASFTFESTDGGVSFLCSLDAGAFVACTSPWSYSSLTDGTHVFSVKAVDGGGPGSPATYSWTIDTVPPTTSIATGPAAVSTSQFAEFTFASNETNVSFTCSLDGSAGSLCFSPQSYTNLPLGNHTFTVAATDTAGNTGGFAEYTWSIVAPADQAPGNVRKLHARVGYRVVKLVWTLPTDQDFNHVLVLRTGGGAGTVPVYEGGGTTYTDTNVNNARSYRYLLITYDDAGNESGGVRLTVTPNWLLLQPKNGSRVTGTPRFAWVRVPKAILYNVQLYRGGKKILSAWPKTNRLRLHRRWRFGGRTYSLTRGQYHWYVWPAFGRIRQAKYGSLLGQSSFTV
jgi:hypothetical protein